MVSDLFVGCVLAAALVGAIDPLLKHCSSCRTMEKGMHEERNGRQQALQAVTCCMSSVANLVYLRAAQLERWEAWVR